MSVVAYNGHVNTLKHIRAERPAALLRFIQLKGIESEAGILSTVVGPHWDLSRLNSVLLPIRVPRSRLVIVDEILATSN
jgi:hypothetical protein